MAFPVPMSIEWFLSQIFLYSPVASINITLLHVSFTVDSINFATVQLFPPPVVPTTAQCLPNRAFKDILQLTLFEVKRPIGA